MTILLLLIPIGILFVVVAVATFVWAVRNGQFEDLEDEGVRMLFDDEPTHPPDLGGERGVGSRRC